MNKTDSKEKIINSLLTAMADTASSHQFEKHMNLISIKVEIYGIPGFDTIGYDD